MGKSHDLATGVAYQDQTETDARYHTKTASNAAFVAKAGDTMTGDLNIQSGAISSVALTGSTRSDLFLIDNAAPTDRKRQTIRSDGGDLIFGTENDAINNFTFGMTLGSSGLNVEGKLHGHNIDLENIKEWNITGSYSAGTDYVFSTRTEIQGLGKGNGFYKFLVFTDSYNAGLSHYSVYTTYSTFFFANQACNTNIMQTLTWPGVNMGHAANTGNRAVDIKVHHVYSSDANYPANQKFIFNPLVGMSNLSGGAGYTMRIYLFKVA